MNVTHLNAAPPAAPKANPFAGLTTFAARFVESVASSSASIEITTTGFDPSIPTSWTGSQIASPKTTTVAAVTMTPMKQKRVMVGGRPINCPSIWSRCDRQYRVKSGMFSESVAQNPTIAVSRGKKTVQKPDPSG